MVSQKGLRRAVLPLAALALLTIGSQHGRPQVPPPDIKNAPPPIPQLDLAPPPAIKPTQPAPPPNVDVLIDQLEQLRKQKAELEAREKALVEQLKGRLKNQSERLQKLGISAPVEPPAPVREDVKIPDIIVPVPPSK